MDRWTEIELFVHTAELGSMSKAAEVLGISNAAASRHLASLEQRLGAGLVHRTTRRLTLSEVGEHYYKSCKSVLTDLKEADRAVSAVAENPVGTLRISASLSFSLQHIAPLLSQYTARYPEVTAQIEATNRYHDLIDANIDVAIREYDSVSNVTIRRLAQSRRILCASPAFLTKHGVPSSVNSLVGRPMLLYTQGNNLNELLFRRGGESEQVTVTPILASNDCQVLRAAALEGLGIAIQPKYTVYDDLGAGRLVSILDEWDLPRLQIDIAFQSRRHMSAKVRTFIDFLVEHFHRMDFERKWTSFDQPTLPVPSAKKRHLEAALGQVAPAASKILSLAH